MGFLEREQRRLLREAQAQAAAVLAKIAAQQKAAAGALEAQILQAETEKLGIEDNKKIAEILTNLPFTNFQEYLDLVRQHSGYDYKMVLYTRGKGVDLDILDKLSSKGFPLRNISYSSRPATDSDGNTIYSKDGKRELRVVTTSESIPTLPIQMRYCGDETNFGGFFGGPRPEPQEPGIGVHFNLTRTKSKQNGGYVAHSTKSQNVYLRLVAPAVMVITGEGKPLEVTSLEALDRPLGVAFRQYHVTRTFMRSQILHSPGFG